ncbi:hypothetical protein N0V88_001227 [Collariella sp. IMI 366227]|nr:hypothetical protein N0V88_001227 [Collariella sp. IMI 366227]
MAFLTQFGALTDELVAAVSGIPQTNNERRDACREFALRSLRHNTLPRTNQFDVKDRLNGLEERFYVVGRDALGEALRKRLNALEPHHNQFTPEALHFLLELADQPAQNSKLSDLDALIEPEEEAPAAERDIWRFVDYAPGSSDEEDLDGQSDGALESLTTASSAEDSCQRTAQNLATKPQGEDLVKQVEDSQVWRNASIKDAGGRPRKIPISTTQLLREALFMLAGLETSLFDQQCNPVTRYQLWGVSYDSYKALVTSFAECSRKLLPLRAFSRGSEQPPLLQVFQGCAQNALHSLDTDLSLIQTRLVTRKEDVVISLIGVLEELGPKLAPLYALADIVRRLQEERNSHAFRYLELLYDAAGIAQLQGNSATYRLLGTIFFDCFQVYLKPIRLWMEEGKLLPGDRTFFVSELPTKLPLPQIWKRQFNLLRTPDGNLHAPRFLKPAIHRIFTAGKSIVVLKHMKQHESTKKYRAGAEPKMDFATVCPDELELAPLSELFNTAFHAWIQSKHHTAAATLRELLFSSHGLSEALDALEHIYLMSDGSRSGAFASLIFRHLDNFSSSWKDRFTLTEIAQEAFSGCVDTYRLSAEVDARSTTHHSAITARSTVRHSLPAIRLQYRLSWPVQTIIPSDAIHSYQTIFTFQLQARRALSVLQHPILFLQRHTSTSSGLPTYHILRIKLLWFINTLTTYLTTLVLAPNTARLRTDLRDAADVDDMIAAHASFVRRIVNEACQGARLQPIRECVLDVFDLAINLEDVQRAETGRLEEEGKEVERLSVLASPFKSPAKSPFGASVTGRPKAKRRRSEEEDDDDVDDDGDEKNRKMLGTFGKGRGSERVKPHAVVMREMLVEFERHVRFIAGGLRGVARASREEAAAKWDMLAEMLELRILQASGIKVLGMLGGAAPGTFTRLDTDDPTVFSAYYTPLAHLIRERALDGLDLDVEEPMSLRGIIQLIDRLRSDFGPDFLITLAPVAAALLRAEHNLSGFDYEALEVLRGGEIAWYNAQFYCGWGDCSNPAMYEMLLVKGWAAERIVVGLVTNPKNGRHEMRTKRWTLMRGRKRWKYRFPEILNIIRTAESKRNRGRLHAMVWI